MYGLLFKLSKNNRIDKKEVEELLDKEFFDGFQKRKEILQLHQSFDSFEKRCYIANKLLVKKVYFLESMKDAINFVILFKKTCRVKIKIYGTFHLV